MSKILPLAITGAAAYYFWPQIESFLGITAAPAINPAAAAGAAASTAAAAGASPVQQAAAAQAASTAAAAQSITAPPVTVITPLAPSDQFTRAVEQAGYSLTSSLNWYQWDYLFNAAYGYHVDSLRYGIDANQPISSSTFWGAIQDQLQPTSAAQQNANAVSARRRGI